jgi:hypothetical protein
LDKLAPVLSFLRVDGGGLADLRVLARYFAAGAAGLELDT